MKVDFIWNSLIFNLYENQLNLNIQEVNRELELMKKEKKIIKSSIFQKLFLITQMMKIY